MAQRRMFSLHVVDTDLFLDMPAAAQSLYFHLSMRADDDGFVANPRKIMKICNSSDDDYRLLLAKRFLIPFDSGICVIRHWRIHNYIQKDRYNPTLYVDEKSKIVNKNGRYEEMDTGCIQDASTSVPQVRLGKVSLGKEDNSPPAQKVQHEELDVPMNRTRYDNLCEHYGQTLVDDYIQRVIDWTQATGKRTKDYAARAGTWLSRDEQEGKLHAARASPTPDDPIQDFSHLRSEYGN